MTKITHFVQVVAGWLTTVARLGSALFALLMMLVTVVDVIGRYVFNAPLLGALEMTEVLMGLLVFMGMPLATARREHITISLLGDALPKHLAVIQTRIFEAICGGVSLFVAWRMWIYAQRLVRNGDHTQQLHISVGSVVQVMAVLLAITGIIFLVNACRKKKAVPDATDLSAV